MIKDNEKLIIIQNNIKSYEWVLNLVFFLDYLLIIFLNIDKLIILIYFIKN